MTIDQIRKVARSQPFVPFIISLADGRRLRVRHPETIMVPPEASRTFIVAESGEDYGIVDLLLVTSLDFGNGRRKRNGRKA